MENKRLEIGFLAIAIPALLVLNGCRSVHAQAYADAASAPPNAKVVPFADASLFSVERPEQFPLAAATERPSISELNVTGVVTPDASRQVPVPSLATGRVVELDARLGDTVNKGQLLFKVRSTDIAGAFSNYRQAVKSQDLAVDNERLTTIQLNRAKILFEQGAIPKSTLEVAENTEIGTQTALANAKIVTETANEQLQLLGVSHHHAEVFGRLADLPEPERLQMKLVTGCEQCNATGKTYTGKRCPHCDGRGTVWVVVRTPDFVPPSG